jgi:hypothetical protein
MRSRSEAADAGEAPKFSVRGTVLEFLHRIRGKRSSRNGGRSNQESDMQRQERVNYPFVIAVLLGCGVWWFLFCLAKIVLCVITSK